MELDGRIVPLSRMLWKILYRLRYLEGVSDVEALSSRLGIPDHVVERNLKILKEHLKSKLNVITPERLEYVCPECLDARVYTDPENGERICANCGLVLEEAKCYSQDLPFDTTYALTSELAYGRSLGGTLGYRGMLRVLAKSPSSSELSKNGGNHHLGLRARLAQIIAETVEPEPTREALRHTKELSAYYGLGSDYVFNDSLGILIKRAYFFAYNIAKKAVFKRRLAETCFWMTLKTFGRKELAERFQKEYEVNHVLAIALEEFNDFLMDVKDRGKLRAKVLKAFPSLSV